MIDSTRLSLSKESKAERPKPDGAKDTVDRKATMHADLDTLCPVIYCTDDDLLPAPKRNARRRVTDAEVVNALRRPGGHGLTLASYCE